jgi:hypothetical protein
MQFDQRFCVVGFSLFTALLLTSSLSGCGGGDGGGDSTDPTVSVATLPATVNRTVELQATASDAVGVTQVEFFIDGTSIGTDSTAPYTMTWDTSTAAEGAHQVTATARDAAGNSATSSQVAVTVSNQLAFALTLTGDQEFPVTGSAGTASGTITVNVATGATTGSITVGGFTANAAHIHDAFAGRAGGIVIGLNANGTDPNIWEVPAGSTLTSEQINRLLQGALYLNVHSAAHPAGEVRAQLLPADFTLVFTDLTGAEEVPPVATAGSARAAATVDTAARTVTINVNTVGLDTANAAHIHSAPPGQSGDPLVTLAQDTTTPSIWFATGATITAAQLADFEANEWYVNVHTPANPNGEVRGQIIAVPPDTEDPTVALGTIAGTVSGTITLTATADDNLDVAEVRFLVDGTVIGSDTAEPYSFDWNTTGTANGNVQVTAEAEDAAGNIGTSAAVATTVDNPSGPAAFTFSEIQTQVFNARCTGCHSGAGAPQGLNLSAGASYGLLVNVASAEVPSLMRVEPGNADDSYIIHKLEGASSIVGVRMPAGGPFLDQATIDRIRAWIDSGAPNN